MKFLILLPLLKLVSALCSLPGQSSCPNLVTSDVPDPLLYTGQPTFLTFVTNTTQYQGVDSVCVTVDCLPDGSGYYIITQTLVYADGSVSVVSLIRAPVSTGLDTYSSASFYQYKYSLGLTDCGTYVKYVCAECGQDPDSFGYGTTQTYGQTSSACLGQATNLLAAQGLDSTPTTVFPMSLPPKCYFSSCTNCYQSQNPCTSSTNGYCP